MTSAAADEDYKAFLLPIHPGHGILLLYCTRKKSKGPHHQLPGGHVDKEDFDDAAKRNPEISGTDHILQACKIGAARELFEETGMDLRSSLDRLTLIQVRKSGEDEEDDKLPNQYKKRVFFSVDISDDDLLSKGLGLVTAINKDLTHLKLKLSHEHQGFVFEPSLTKAADLLTKHSGGKISIALRTAIDLGSVKCPAPIKVVTADEPETRQNDDNLQPETKDIFPAKEEKGMLDCFNCWRGK